MFVIEKLLTSLVMPCGLLWLGLIAATLFAWRQRERLVAVALLCLTVALTIAGNGFVGAWGMAQLERDYIGINALEEGPFDIVFVLGGGVGHRANGSPQLNGAGDRVALGARMYHAKLATKVACTGESQFANEKGPADLTAVVWRQLDIPDSDIIQLPGGDTSEEIAAIQRLVTQSDVGRIGLVTSAWHMRRARRLARRAGLELQPLPADFRGVMPSSYVLSIVPSAEGLQVNQLAMKEFLAMIVGR